MTDIKAVVLQALNDVVKDEVADEILPQLKAGHDVEFEALDLDSLSRFDVMMKIEDALDVELDDDEMLAQGSVGALITYLEAGHGKV